MNFDLTTHPILLTVAGSRAYGMHRPDSDVDVKGVAIPPRAYFHGYLHRFDQADGHANIREFTSVLTDAEREVAAATKLEGSVYDIRKFVTLAADANPNILDVLFCRDDEVRVRTPLGDRLREARDLFVSAKAKHTFSGYAAAQLKRIRGHRAWLLSPPSHEPTRADFDLPEHTLLPADHLAAIKAAVQKQLDLWESNFASLTLSDRVAVQNGLADYLQEFCAALPEGLVDEEDRLAGARYLAAARHIGVSDNLIWVLQREREYEAARRHFKQYLEWQRSRNVDRAALEAKYGYDTKHGAHLVRLLRMGGEILATGRVNVWREDAEELLSIRAGAWSYDRLVAYTESLDAALNAKYAAGDFVVPKAPDRNEIDALCVDLVESHLGRGPEHRLASEAKTTRYRLDDFEAMGALGVALDRFGFIEILEGVAGIGGVDPSDGDFVYGALSDLDWYMDRWTPGTVQFRQGVGFHPVAGEDDEWDIYLMCDRDTVTLIEPK